MKTVIFCHSLRSDWNHGNAHFLRCVVTDLIERGHEVAVYEPRDAWSAQNLVAEYGAEALDEYRAAYPLLDSFRYDSLDLDKVLKGAEMVIVHEWNDHSLVAEIGRHRANHPYVLLFHDTHHRSVTDPASMSEYDLRHYDGVLAFGDVVRDLYLKNGWAKQAWTVHEAADINVFAPDPCMAVSREPLRSREKTGDLVWIGNWGDDERTAELNEFLIRPVKELGLRATVYGVRYPDSALQTLKEAGIRYGGWLPNFRVPEVFAQHKVTVHVPRGPYVKSLPGIPTIRPFEALACGIPLVSAPWHDSEGLFREGDFLWAQDGAEMKSHLRWVLDHPFEAGQMAERGLETVHERHTCGHRVDQILGIYEEIKAGQREHVST